MKNPQIKWRVVFNKDDLNCFKRKLIHMLEKFIYNKMLQIDILIIGKRLTIYFKFILSHEVYRTAYLIAFWYKLAEGKKNRNSLMEFIYINLIEQFRNTRYEFVQEDQKELDNYIKFLIKNKQLFNKREEKNDK